VITAGQQLLSGRHQCPADVVEPKCVELQRVCTILSQRLERRLHMLTKCRELMERIDKVHFLPFEFIIFSFHYRINSHDMNKIDRLIPGAREG